MRWRALPFFLVFAGAAPAGAQLQLAPEPLTIERAVEISLVRNERAKIAGEGANIGQARLQRARSFFFPELSLAGTWTHRDHETLRSVGPGIPPVVIQSRDGLSATATASLTLFDARGIPAWRAARHERDAARLDATEARRQLAFETADAYLLTMGLLQVREAASRRQDLARESLGDARSRFEAELVGSNDVTKAELELATAERELTRAGGEAGSALLALGFLLDQPVTPPLAEPDALLAQASKPAGDLGELSVAARARRPDLAADRKHSEALRLLAQEPSLRVLPTFTGFATWRATNEAGFSGRDEDYWLGVNASWVLFDGGERYGEAKERRALARIASHELRAAERALDSDVATAVINLKTAQAASKAAAVAAEVAGKNVAETSALYRQGLASALELADAKVRLFEADVALARERYGLGISWLGIPEAQGFDPFGKDAAP